MIELTGILVVDLLINILGAIICVSAIIGALIIFFIFASILTFITVCIVGALKVCFGKKEE